MATLNQAAPGLIAYGVWLVLSAVLLRRMQRAARKAGPSNRPGIRAGQATLMLLVPFAIFALVLHLNALSCPGGIEGGVMTPSPTVRSAISSKLTTVAPSF